MVEHIIKTLSLRKSIGSNSIPTKILKRYSKTIDIPISKLINQSFVTGIFPELLKLRKSRSSGTHQLLTRITNLKYQQYFRKNSP